MKNIVGILLFIVGCSMNEQDASQKITYEESDTNVGKNIFEANLFSLKSKIEALEKNLNNNTDWIGYFHLQNELASQFLIAENVASADSIINSTITNGQKFIGKDDARLSILRSQLGRNAIKSGDYSEAVKFFKDAQLQLEQVDSKEFIKSLVGEAYTYQRYYRKFRSGKYIEDSFSILNNALVEAKRIKSEEVKQEILINIAENFLITSQFDTAIAIIDKIIEQPNITEYNLIKANLILGDCTSEIGSLEKMFNAYRKAYVYAERTLPSNSVLLGYVYSVLSYAYETMGKLDKAIEFSEKSNRIYKSINYKIGYIANLINQGNFKQGLGLHKKALVTYTTALRISYEEKYKYGIYSLHNNIGGVYSVLNNLDSSLYHHDKSLSIRLEELGRDHNYTALSHISNSSTYIKIKDFDKAEYHLLESYDILMKIDDRDEVSLITTLRQLGNLYTEQSQYEKAIAFFQKAIQIQQPSYDTIDIYEQPSTKRRILSEIYLAELLSEKANTLHLFYEETGKEIYYRAADSTYKEVFNLIDYARNAVINERSKGFILRVASTAYKNAMQHKIYQYQKTKDPKLLTQAFDIAEKSKSVLLNESVKESDAKIQSGMSEEDMEREKALAKSIADVDKRYYKAQEQENPNQTRIDELENERFDLKREYEAFIRDLEQNYPTYYQLKYNLETLPLEKVNEILPNDNTALIEYFVSDSTIYAFVVGASRQEVVEIKKDFSLVDLVKQFQRSIYSQYVGKSRSTDEILNYIDTLANSAYQLHQKLIAPVKAVYDLPKELIIVPDGLLGYIPFELLLKSLPEDNTIWKDYDYLIKDHQISYSYSATLLQEMQNKSFDVPRRNLVAFAPKFEKADTVKVEKKKTDADKLFADVDDTKEAELIAMSGIDEEISYIRGELGPLKHNVPEVKGIKRIVGGDLYINEEAIEDNFISVAVNYRIVHLSTHGKANDEVGDYAYLAFTETKDSIENEFIYNRDLYNLDLNADMVVLSACETGVGELKNGEGIISLARGFSYAGAKSIVTTLWSVDDGKTKELMESFYRYIKKGASKDAALRQAKLDFLGKYKSDAHPFYWAAFIPIGDMQPIELQSSSYWWWIAGVGVVVLLFLLWKNRKNEEK